MEGIPFGQYHLLELLGRGGMGEVWRAYDTVTDRIVAIKVLPAHLAQDPAFVRRFQREAQAAARLNSPHVVPIHTHGEIDGRLYVDMRLIEGRDLQEVLADGPLELSRAVRVIEQVAKALHAAHKVGLVHRDVKPSNILLDEDDFAYLIDFGIARAADATVMTQSGSVIGTWYYMAPERFTADNVDARADIYALACVLYECLTDRQPYPGDRLEQQFAAHLNEPPPRPSSTQPQVPAQFDAVIAKGMAKTPDERYATTVELAQAAREAITAPIPRPIAEPLTPPTPTQAAPARVADPVSRRGGVSSPGKTQHRQLREPLVQPPQKSPPQHRSRRRIIVIAAVLVVVVAVAGLAIGREIVRSNYYVSEHAGAVYIMQGVQGSFLGISLQQPFRLACLDAGNEVKLILADGDRTNCQLLKVGDLRETARAQVTAGLPTGSVDDAIRQLKELTQTSLLPTCAPRTSTPTTTSPSPTPAPTSIVTALPPPPPEPGSNCRTVE